MKGRSRFTPGKMAAILIVSIILFVYIMVLRAFNLVSAQGLCVALPHLVVIALFGIVETLLLASVVDFRPSDPIKVYPWAILAVVLCLLWLSGGFAPIAHIISH